MTLTILLAAVVVIICVLLNKLSHRIGIPMLLAFIVLGMLFGSDGIFRIPFENYYFSEQICSLALIFIIFYGGFGMNWEQAKPVALKATLLSTLGVALTAGLTGLFCHFVLRTTLLESLLIGAVVSSTDAASVFSILRSQKLGLKHNTDSMLELESGSNDPCSYMLTIIVLSIMGGGISVGNILGMLVFQLLFGALIGIAAAVAAGFLLRHCHFETAGFDMAFLIGTALLSYSLAVLIGGNGYLSAYICGIILGNMKTANKKALVHFFDGITGLMQMLIFFLLGLLATPSKIPAIFLPALCIMLFLTLIARPVSVFAVLSPFRCGIRQQLLVSFAGLRGAASIVFAIYAIVNHPELQNDLFHIVFCIVLLSISFQGIFLPFCARFLDMSDKQIDIMKTFSDYSEEANLQFIRIRMHAGHSWAGRAVGGITLPPDTLIVMLLRGDSYLVPDGNTVLLPGDTAILSAHPYEGGHELSLQEQIIKSGSRWIGRPISEYSPQAGELVIMIVRNDQTIIPKGNTVIQKGDILVINSMP